jgi:hypothetical protein
MFEAAQITAPISDRLAPAFDRLPGGLDRHLGQDRQLVVRAFGQDRAHQVGIDDAVLVHHEARLDARRLLDELGRGGGQGVTSPAAMASALAALKRSTKVLKASTSSVFEMLWGGVYSPVAAMTACGKTAVPMTLARPLSEKVRARLGSIGRSIARLTRASPFPARHPGHTSPLSAPRTERFGAATIATDMSGTTRNGPKRASEGPIQAPWHVYPRQTEALPLPRQYQGVQP